MLKMIKCHQTLSPFSLFFPFVLRSPSLSVAHKPHSGKIQKAVNHPEILYVLRYLQVAFKIHRYANSMTDYLTSTAALAKCYSCNFIYICTMNGLHG